MLASALDDREANSFWKTEKGFGPLEEDVERGRSNHPRGTANASFTGC
jgi:hypothetical protein